MSEKFTEILEDAALAVDMEVGRFDGIRFVVNESLPEGTARFQDASGNVLVTVVRLGSRGAPPNVEPVICPTCDKPMPDGCGGEKINEGRACWRNREPGEWVGDA